MLFKCLIGFADGFVGKSDGIEHDGKLWLVPQWLHHETKEHAIPKRMIRFDNLRFQEIDEGDCKYANIVLPINEGDFSEGDLPGELEHIDNALHVRIPVEEFDAR